MITTIPWSFQIFTTNAGWRHKRWVKCDFMPAIISTHFLRVIESLWVVASFFPFFAHLRRQYTVGKACFFDILWMPYVYFNFIPFRFFMKTCKVIKGQVKVKCGSEKWTLTESSTIKLNPSECTFHVINENPLRKFKKDFWSSALTFNENK